MNIITFDQGNSTTSAYCWTENGEGKEVPWLQKNFDHQTCISSNVGQPNQKLPKNTHFVSYDGSQSFCTMPVNYSKSIGIDRLLFSLSIYSKMNKENEDRFLLVDAGTFLTIDLLDAKGFHGGMILPGENLIQQSYSKGEGLKNLIKNIRNKKQYYPIQNSEGAVNESWAICLEALYQKLILQNNINKIYFSGGGSKFQMDLTKNLQLDTHYELEYVPNAVHHGLYLYYKTTVAHSDLDNKTFL